MNSSPPPSTRFSCRMIRRWSAVAGSTAPRHVATCPACQAFFAAGNRLDLALTRAAAAESQPAPAGLERRIVQAIDFSRRPATRSARHGTLLSLSGVAACALAVLFTLRQPTTPALGVARAPAIFAEAAVGDDAAAEPSWSLQLLTQNPLQNEVDAVYAHARSAVRFLALNFLPTPSPGAFERGDATSRRAANGG